METGISIHIKPGSFFKNWTRPVTKVIQVSKIQQTIPYVLQRKNLKNILIKNAMITFMKKWALSSLFVEQKNYV